MNKILAYCDRAAGAGKIAEFLQKCGCECVMAPSLEDAAVACASSCAAVFVMHESVSAWAEKVRSFALRCYAGVLVIVREGAQEETEKELAGTGVFVLPANVPVKMLTQAVIFAIRAGERLRALHSENTRLKETIDDLKLIDRAKCALIQYLNMSEADAHRFIEKSPMNKRVPRRDIALEILKTYES